MLGDAVVAAFLHVLDFMHRSENIFRRRFYSEIS